MKSQLEASRYAKQAVKSYLVQAKSAFKTESTLGIKNVYHACIQKTGSQWIKCIFNDKDIKSITGLETYPQFRYEWGEFVKKFPKNTFVPGLYVPYQLYKEIKKPNIYKTFYVIRDPRDVLISWYYSIKYTHSPTGSVPRHRSELKRLDEPKGIEYSIHHLQLKFSFMRTWWENSGDENVLIVRFEELTQDPVKEFKKIFDHCGINISSRKLSTVLNKYTKEKMRKRDLRNRQGERSHYRRNKKDWREMFEDRHIDLFQNVNGDLVDRLGYKW